MIILPLSRLFQAITALLPADSPCSEQNDAPLNDQPTDIFSRLGGGKPEMLLFMSTHLSRRG